MPFITFVNFKKIKYFDGDRFKSKDYSFEKEKVIAIFILNIIAT